MAVVTLGNIPWDLPFQPKTEVKCETHYKWTTCEVVKINRKSNEKD